MTPVPVVFFADFTCPFSYVTEVALWKLAEEIPLAAAFRSLELYPRPAPLPFDALQARVDAARPLAEALGVELRAPSVLPRTRKAHEAGKFAAEKGVEQPLRLAMYDALFARGLDIGRIDVLAELASAQGLDPTEARVVLDVDRYTDAVLADAALARRAGAGATPTLVVGTGAEARVVAGALRLHELRSIIQDS